MQDGLAIANVFKSLSDQAMQKEEYRQKKAEDQKVEQYAKSIMSGQPVDTSSPDYNFKAHMTASERYYKTKQADAEYRAQLETLREAQYKRNQREMDNRIRLAEDRLSSGNTKAFWDTIGPNYKYFPDHKDFIRFSDDYKTAIVRNAAGDEEKITLPSPEEILRLNKLLSAEYVATAKALAEKADTFNSQNGGKLAPVHTEGGEESAYMERIALWFYKAFHDSQVYTAAAPPESNLKKLLWGEIGGLVEKHSGLFKSDTVKVLHVERSAKSFTTGVTIPMSGTEAQRQAKFSGKHAPHLLFILDEGDAIPDEVYTAIESCLSGGHGRLLVMFNPRAEAGEAYRMERDGRANVVRLSAFNHLNVVNGEDRIPGAVNRSVTVCRINEWCRPLAEGERPDGECFELPAFLEGAVATSQAGHEYPPLRPGWHKIMEPAFSYMVLGEYPPII